MYKLPNLLWNWLECTYEYSSKIASQCKLVALILVFLLQRSTAGTLPMKSRVQIPIDTDICPVVAGCRESDSVYYTIHSAVKWSGRGTTSGHYTAFILQGESEMTELNDSTVTIRNLHQVLEDSSFEKGVWIVFISEEIAWREKS